MLDNEMYSIMLYIEKTINPPHVFHTKVPDGFKTPAVYYPVPELLSGGDTFSTYKLSYLWLIKFFADKENQAADMAYTMLDTIRYHRNKVQLMGYDNAPVEGRFLRLKDPTMRYLSDTSPEVVQLTLSWDSRRPYYREPVQKAQHIHLDIYTKSAIDKAIEKSGGRP